MNPSDDLRVQQSKHGGIIVLEVSGDVDFAVQHRFRAAVEEAVASSRTSLVVDLQAVRFIDSSGIGVLTKAYSTLRERGDRLALIITSPAIQRTFELLRLDTILGVHTGLDAALKALE